MSENTIAKLKKQRDRLIEGMRLVSSPDYPELSGKLAK
jgi:hypothetical protein